MLLIATIYPVSGTLREEKVLEGQKNLVNNDQTESGDWWPMYRHDPSNTGCSSSIAPVTNQLNWKQTIGDNILSATPIIYEDRLFISTNWYYNFINPPNMSKTPIYKNPSPNEIIEALTTYNEEFFGGLYCLNADTGTPLWSYPLYAPNDPAVVDDKLYVTDLDLNYLMNSNLYCLDAEDGDYNWQQPLDGLCLSPTIVADEKIFICLLNTAGYNVEGALTCFDLDGNDKWTYPLPSDEIIFGSAPAYYDGKVYFLTSGMSYSSGNLYCINAETGQFIWSKPIFSYMYWFGSTSPACTDGKVYAVDFDIYGYSGSLKCFDADTGDPLWSRNIGWSFSTPAICGDSVFVTALNLYFYNSRLYRINAESGAIIWYVPIPGSTYFFSSGSPICADNKVFVSPTDYFYSYSNDLYCFDMENGDLIWNYELDYESMSAPAIADERIYVADYLGTVYAIEDLLKIWDISGGIMNVNAEIKNIGDFDFSNVSWSISVSGGMLGLINRTDSGNIPTLEAGESKLVRALPVFGLGKIEIIVTTSMPGINTIRKSSEGFVLGPLVFISS